MMIIDPPSGWQYGFPKQLPDDVKDVDAWLVEQGYPQSEVDYWKRNGRTGVPCRYWTQTDDV